MSSAILQPNPAASARSLTRSSRPPFPVWIAIFIALLWRSEAAEESAPELPHTHQDWKIELVAKAPDIRHPSVVCVAPDGRLFVAEDPMDISTATASQTEGRILCIQLDGKISVFADHLHAVFGMKYLEGKLYVLHNPQLTRFVDDHGVGKERVDLITSTLPNPWAENWNDHVPANFVLGMDGYFYVAVGDKGLYGATGRDGSRIDMRGGGVIRLRPDGTELEIYATGLRNIMDVAITDEDELFTYDNTDEKRWMSRLSHIVASGEYGCPYDFNPRKPYILWCMADYGPGAATGVFADTEGALPEPWRGSLFLGDFGKRQVTAVPISRKGATFTAGTPTPLLTDPPGDFRPVGIAASVDGSGIYVCDWQHRDSKEKVIVGRLWKLTHRKPVEQEPYPAWYIPAASGQTNEATVQDFLAGLDHPSRAVRIAAQRSLSAKGSSSVADLIEVLQNPRFSRRARSHALWALDAVDGGESARPNIIATIYSLDEGVRRQCLRQLGLRKVRSAVAEIIGRLEDEDASVRFQAATALGRIGDPSAISSLHQLLISSEEEETVRFAAFTALNKIGKANPTAWSRLVGLLDHPRPQARDRVSLALRNTYELPLVEALVAFANNSSLQILSRLQAIQLLSDVHRRLPVWKGEWWVYHPADAPAPEKTEVWDGSPLIAKLLTTLAKDNTPAIRRAAIAAIGRARVVEPAFALRTSFDQETDPDFRQLLMDTFGKLRDPQATPYILRTLESKEASSNLLQSALISAAQIGAPSNQVTELLASAVGRYVDQAAPPVDLVVRGLETLGQLREPSVLPVVYRRLKDLHPDIVVAAIRVLDPLGGSSAEVAPLLQDTRVPIRSATIRFLGQTKAKEYLPQLLPLANDDSLRDEVLKAVCRMPDVTATDLLVNHLQHRNLALRELIQTTLVSLGAEALPRIEKRAAELSEATKAALRTLYATNTTVRLGPLFASREESKTPEEYASFAKSNSGNPMNGQRLFLTSEGVACVKCHRVRESGGEVGPDLSQIGSQLDRAALVESVLYPSRIVREGYQQIVIELKSGDRVSGLLKAETAQTVTLRDAEGKDQPIAKTEIASRNTSSLSLMPEGLQGPLSLQEFSDLIAYLEHLKTPTSSARATAPPQFISLFNGTNLAGWKTDPELLKHWTVSDGVLEHDGKGEDLWTESEFGDFRLQFEWRWVEPPKLVTFSLIDTNGNPVLNELGKQATGKFLDAGDSGIYLRGLKKAEVNLFSHPLGSGDISPARIDPSMSSEQRRSFTSRLQADNPLGEWNSMSILVRADRISVVVNGEEVISRARLMEIPERGPIGLQRSRQRLQFRNIFLRPIEDLR